MLDAPELAFEIANLDMRYVLELGNRVRGLDEPAQQVVFETVRLWGGARFNVPAQDILGGSYHPGMLETPSHSVNAPFYFVRLRGRKLALILDGQGQFLRPGITKRVLGLS